jgi:hypothetical protein
MECAKSCVVCVHSDQGRELSPDRQKLGLLDASGALTDVLRPALARASSQRVGATHSETGTQSHVVILQKSPGKICRDL